MRRTPSPTATATTAVATGSVGVRRLVDRAAAGDALAHPALLLDLLEEVGDPDLPGPADVDGGLDGGADVVGVDVAVPDAVAADDDDRVADAGPHVLEGGDRLVGRLEEVHDLVAEVGDAAVVVLVVGHRRQAVEVGVPASTAGSGTARPSTTWRSDVEQQEEPGAAGVDDAGLGEHGQHLGRAGQGVGAAVAGGVEHRRRGRRLRRRRRGRLGRLPHDGEDRALDRLHHRAVGRRRRLGQRRGDTSARPARSPSRNTSARPRRIWDRITPELPRAPMSDPWLIALHVGAMSAPRRRRRAPRTPTRRVSAMLVPVSPSGTG